MVYLSNGRSVAAARKGNGQNRYWGYTLSSVPAGQYSLSAELPGYRIIPMGFSLPLTINANLSSINFTGSVASVAGSVSGRITQQGVPVPGVMVQASQGGSQTGSGISDSEGYYRIPNLASGTCTLVPTLTGYSFSSSSLIAPSVPATGSNFSATGPNPPPVITALTASPAALSDSSATTTLSASATGSGTLTYGWEALSAPAPVSFSLNDSPQAAATTVSFQAPGIYTFRARVTDANGLPATASATVTVNAGPGTMAVLTLPGPGRLWAGVGVSGRRLGPGREPSLGSSHRGASPVEAALTAPAFSWRRFLAGPTRSQPPRAPCPQPAMCG